MGDGSHSLEESFLIVSSGAENEDKIRVRLTHRGEGFRGRLLTGLQSIGDATFPNTDPRRHFHKYTTSTPTFYGGHRRGLTAGAAFPILLRALLGTWRNWHTRVLEGHVPQGLEVQILSSPLFLLTPAPTLGGAAVLGAGDGVGDHGEGSDLAPAILDRRGRK